MLDSGRSGELYGGLRWPGDKADKRGWLTARLGAGGFRIVSNDNTREIMVIDNNGGIFLNGTDVAGHSPLNGEILVSKKSLLFYIILGLMALMVANAIMIRIMVRSALRSART